MNELLKNKYLILLLLFLIIYELVHFFFTNLDLILIVWVYQHLFFILFLLKKIPSVKNIYGAILVAYIPILLIKILIYRFELYWVIDYILNGFFILLVFIKWMSTRQLKRITIKPFKMEFQWYLLIVFMIFMVVYSINYYTEQSKKQELLKTFVEIPAVITHVDKVKANQIWINYFYNIGNKEYNKEDVLIGGFRGHEQVVGDTILIKVSTKDHSVSETYYESSNW